LSAREQVVGMKRVDVTHLMPMAAGDDLHVAVAGRAVREADPRGHDVWLTQSPVGRVLMPGDVARAARLLREEGAVPAQDVRADDVLDGVEDCRMANEVGQPGQEQVRLDAVDAPQRLAQLALDGFESLP